MIDKAKAYGISCHRTTNHLYDGKPYEVHLTLVFETAQKFIHLIPDEAQAHVLSACWVHDVIEDCRQTYNDVKQATDERVAELAYALTNEKGKTRKERANDKYYAGIRETPHAVFVKLCDRIANYEYSKRGNNRMAELYEKENSEFMKKLFDAQYEEMFVYLDTQMATV